MLLVGDWVIMESHALRLNFVLLLLALMPGLSMERFESLYRLASPDYLLVYNLFEVLPLRSLMTRSLQARIPSLNRSIQSESSGGRLAEEWPGELSLDVWVTRGYVPLPWQRLCSLPERTTQALQLLRLILLYGSGGGA